MSFLDVSKATDSSFAPLPQGEYLVISDDVAIKQNSAGTGDIMKVTYRVLEPEAYKGKKLFENYNIRHETSPKAVEISLGKIKDFLVKSKAPSLVLDKAHDILSLKAIAVVKHRADQNGQPSANISYFKGIDSWETSTPAIEGDLPF